MTNLHFQNLLFLGIIYYGQKNQNKTKKNFTPAPPIHNTHTCTGPHKLIHNKKETLFPQMENDNAIRHAIMLKQSKHGQLQSILLDAD